MPAYRTAVAVSATFAWWQAVDAQFIYSSCFYGSDSLLHYTAQENGILGSLSGKSNTFSKYLYSTQPTLHVGVYLLFAFHDRGALTFVNDAEFVPTNVMPPEKGIFDEDARQSLSSFCAMINHTLLCAVEPAETLRRLMSSHDDCDVHDVYHYKARYCRFPTGWILVPNFHGSANVNFARKEAERPDGCSEEPPYSYHRRFAKNYETEGTPDAERQYHFCAHYSGCCG